MKCKECKCCEKGWFASKPNDYVCIGVKHPFIINDINVECTEYEIKRSNTATIEDAVNHFKYGISHDIFSEPVISYAKLAIEALEKEIEDEEEGHWILLDECSNEGVYCSKCHKKVYKKDYANQKLNSKFCPNCGKRMNGELRVL